MTVAGTLGNILADYPAPVTHLTVIGVIDARDVQYMRDSMPTLENLDISQATIVAYTGTKGTNYGNNTTYPANEMPEYSFYKRNTNSAVSKTSLVSFVFPSDLTSIGDHAFYQCTGLSSILFPAGLTVIGKYAFTRCSGFTSIELPASLTSLEESAFADCSRLTSVLLPAGLTSIGIFAFNNCSLLQQIINQNPVPIAINGNVFTGLDKSGCVLKVHFGSKARYEAAPVWQEFFIMEANVGIEDANDAINAIVVYPNPVQDRLHLNGLSGKEDIILTDISGRTLYRGKSDGATEMSIPVSSLASGMYFVRISTSTATKTMKVVKE
jgi:hypothetical protein